MKSFYLLFIRIRNKIIVESIQLIDRIFSWIRFYIEPEMRDTCEIDYIASSETAAIVAIWQEKINENFLLSLIKLKEMGVYTVVVNNCRMTSVDKKRIESFVSVYHERNPGLGRDFAAYRSGYLSMHEHLEKFSSIKNLFFLNDSVSIIPSRFEACFNRMLMCPGDVIGITETTAVHYHISSWFFLVRRKVYTNKFFIDFWKKYRSYQSRPFVIENGEVGITRCYKRMGAEINVLHTNYSIIETLKSNKVDQLDVRRLLPKTLYDAILDDLKLKGEYVTFWDVLNEYADSINQTHFWQLILLKYFEFPFVKNDIYSRELFTINQLRYVFSDLNDKVASIFYFVTNRLANSEQPWLKSLLIKSCVR